MTPGRGWGDSSDASAAQLSWQSTRLCCFCHSSAEDHVCGRLMVYSDGYCVHVNCLRWSLDVSERENTLLDSYSAREKSISGVCYFCRNKGATVGCCNRKKKCNRLYHLKCALVCKCLLLECRPRSTSEDIQVRFRYLAIHFCAKSSLFRSQHDIHTLTFCPEHASTSVGENNRCVIYLLLLSSLFT